MSNETNTIVMERVFEVAECNHYTEDEICDLMAMDLEDAFEWLNNFELGDK
jgi:hypothetical protein